MHKTIVLTSILALVCGLSCAVVAEEPCKEYAAEEVEPCAQDSDMPCDLEGTPITGCIKNYWDKEKTVLLAEVRYKNGKENGPTTLYSENGKIRREENYKNGQKEGLQRDFAPDGSITETMFKNNQENGITKVYNKDGILVSETNFVKGQKEGEAKEYYDQGTLRLVVTYKNNELDGIAREYYEDGQLKEDRAFDKGKLVRISRYDEQGNSISTEVPKDPEEEAPAEEVAPVEAPAEAPAEAQAKAKAKAK